LHISEGISPFFGFWLNVVSTPSTWLIGFAIITDDIKKSNDKGGNPKKLNSNFEKGL
jgi:hypothetical protein